MTRPLAALRRVSPPEPFGPMCLRAGHARIAVWPRPISKLWRSEHERAPCNPSRRDSAIGRTAGRGGCWPGWLDHGARISQARQRDSGNCGDSGRWRLLCETRPFKCTCAKAHAWAIGQHARRKDGGNIKCDVAGAYEGDKYRYGAPRAHTAFIWRKPHPRLPSTGAGDRCKAHPLSYCRQCGGTGAIGEFAGRLCCFLRQVGQPFVWHTEQRRGDCQCTKRH